MTGVVAVAGYKLGLAVSIVIGVLVAAFPLYADHLAGYIWSLPAGGEEGGEEAYTLQGVVEEVNINESYIVVDSHRLWVTGTWQAPDGSEITSEQLLARLSPGMRVTVEYTRWGRWGYRLVQITIEDTGERYTRLE